MKGEYIAVDKTEKKFESAFLMNREIPHLQSGFWSMILSSLKADVTL